MKIFDEYWKKYAIDEFLSKERVKVLCDDINKELIEALKDEKAISTLLASGYEEIESEIKEIVEKKEFCDFCGKIAIMNRSHKLCEEHWNEYYEWKKKSKNQ